MYLASLGGWAEKWQIKFNVEKFKVMNIGFRSREKHYALNGAPLGVIKEDNELGVIVCQNLKVGIDSVSKPHLWETRG